MAETFILKIALLHFFYGFADFDITDSPGCEVHDRSWQEYKGIFRYAHQEVVVHRYFLVEAEKAMALINFFVQEHGGVANGAHAPV